MRFASCHPCIGFWQLMLGMGWQVVGLKSGWHTGMVMGGVNKTVHAKRLAQASAVRLELRAAGAGALGYSAVVHHRVIAL